MDEREREQARRGKKNHRYRKITIKWNRKHKNTKPRRNRHLLFPPFMIRHEKLRGKTHCCCCCVENFKLKLISICNCHTRWGGSRKRQSVAFSCVKRTRDVSIMCLKIEKKIYMEIDSSRYRMSLHVNVVFIFPHFLSRTQLLAVVVILCLSMSRFLLLILGSVGK